MTLNHSVHIDQIAAALSVLQSKLATVDKAAANPFFKSKYTPLEDIVDSFRPHLAALGLAFTQGAAWIDGRTVMITRVLHSSGQWIESAFPLEPVPDKSGVVTPQGWGSASTYARRYGLQVARGITTGDVDDDGNLASGNEVVLPAKPPAASAGLPDTVRNNDWATLWALVDARGLRKQVEPLRTRGFAAVAEAAGLKVDFSPAPKDRRAGG